MSRPTFIQIALAWSVHLFTASGMLAAFMALVSIDNEEWTNCWWWLLACLIIDGIDGTFARMARVKEVLPQIEGKFMDYVIDFTTYAIIPAFFFYKTAMTSETLMPWAIAIILLSSVLYYGKSDMTGGGGNYFVGFPVLWNGVVFTLFFALNIGDIWNFILILFFGVLHFVPLKFAYPSRAGRFFWGHLVASLATVVGSGSLLYSYPDTSVFARIAIPSAIIWFLVMAVVETMTNDRS